MSKKIIHLPDPDMDYSLCGDSDDGVMVEGGQPNYNTNGEKVNCPRCLRIIAVCEEYTAQQKRAPDSLKAVVSRLPKSPKTGKPLLVKGG